MAREFGQNLAFLSFLVLVKKQPSLKSALGKGNYTALDRYPGLSPHERDRLKMLDWNNVRISVKDSDLTNFRQGGLMGYCETKVGPSAVQKKCYL